MTRAEFVKVMAYITVATGKPLDADDDKAKLRMDVYFDLLGDLSAEVLQQAAKMVCLGHKWATFPQVAELREAAVKVLRGRAKELPPAEAWELAWRAAGKIDPDIDGSIQRACQGLPPLVLEAMEAMGIVAMVRGTEPVGVVRGQFLRMYEQLQIRDDRAALLPPKLQEDIKRIGQISQLIPKIDQIGKVDL